MIDSITRSELFIIHGNEHTKMFQVMEHKLKFPVNAQQCGSELKIIQASPAMLAFKAIGM